MWVRVLGILLFFGLFFGDSQAGIVSGTVKTKAIKKLKQPPRYYLGSYRASRRQTLMEDGGPTDVVVFLEDVKGDFKTPDQLPRMEQIRETFKPHVLPVLAGTTVEFPNEDGFYHNVFSVVSGDRFDLGRYAKGKSARQTFSKPAVVVVRCEIHPGMKAFILVLENPYFAVPDTSGKFEIPSVPAGTYTIKAWHPVHGEQSGSVAVRDSGLVRMDFVF